MLTSLKRFFSEDNRINIMIPIIEGTSKISLRLLDWTVTNYSKKNNTFYSIKEPDGKINHFFVYLNYKAQLKAYSKKEFDPFCRRNRIKFYYDDENFIITTIGQLTFFKWAITYNLIEYVNQNRKTIEDDMNKAIKNAYGSSKKSSSQPSTISNSASDSAGSSSSRKKRQELSESATKRVNKTNFKVTISFD
jgi:hypothetical protein